MHWDVILINDCRSKQSNDINAGTYRELDSTIKGLSPNDMSDECDLLIKKFILTTMLLRICEWKRKATQNMELFSFVLTHDWIKLKLNESLFLHSFSLSPERFHSVPIFLLFLGNWNWVIIIMYEMHKKKFLRSTKCTSCATTFLETRLNSGLGVWLMKPNRKKC